MAITAIHTKEDLAELQALPLELKIKLTQRRIREWYQYFGGQVCVSFSGGKDSTVLLDIVRGIYPDVPAVFSDTGLEYPEIKEFVKTKDNIEIVRPKINFRQVIETYGYPLVSKEVAEAIHYARRILPEERSQTVQVEREREDSRAETERIVRQERGRSAQGSNCLGSGRNDSYILRVGGVGSEEVRQLSNERCSTGNTEEGQKRESLFRDLSQEKRHYRNAGRGGGTPYHRRKNLCGKWELPKTGNRGDAGEGTAGVTSGLSQFNKKKWLLLAENAPFKISHYCCTVMKKGPMGKYQHATGRKPYIGMMAEEGRMRKQAWLRHGCNAFDSVKQTSNPMSFWTEQDVLQYIKERGIEIAPVYGEIVRTDKDGMVLLPWATEGMLATTGAKRTGCIFCAFGLQSEKGETRFQRLKRTHPKLYEYAVGGGQWIDNPDYVDGLIMEPDAIGWMPWNPERIWVPDKNGLGMGFVFDYTNELYGKEIFRYR